MNSFENGWGLDWQFNLILVIIAVQVTLLVLSATLISRLSRVSAMCRHRTWVWVMVLLLGILPSYLLLPSWLSASISVPVTLQIIEPEMVRTIASVQDSDPRPFTEHHQPQSGSIIDYQLGLEKEPSNLPITSKVGSSMYQGEVTPGNDEKLLHDEPIVVPIDNEAITLDGVEGKAITVDSVNAQVADPRPQTSPLGHHAIVLISVYSLACSYLISRIFIGWWRLNRIRRYGKSLDLASLAIAEETSVALRLKSVPKLITSSHVATPMSWGILSPTVFLPESFSTWPSQCRRAVFLHELSHIARRDACFDLIARICSIIYWFHPAVHYAARALANSREEAVDERVIAYGIPPANYARQLLEVAERCKLVENRNRLPATPMATRSSIEFRIRRILQFTNHHSEGWPKWRTALFFVSLASLLLLAVPFRLLPILSQSLVAQDQRENATATSLYQRVQAMELAETSEDATPVTIEGVVRKPDFTPTQAVVFCLHIQDSTAKLLGRSVTDEQGRYSLGIAATDSQGKNLCLCAVDSQNRLGWECGLNHSNAKSKKLYHIPLLLNESNGSIRGELIAPGGKPMSGIRVVAGTIASPKDFSNSFRVDMAPFDFKAVSNESGHFSIDGLPSDMLVGIVVESEEWDSLLTFIGTSSDMPNWVSTAQYFAGSALIKLFPRIELAGIVVDSEGKSVADARIGFQWETTTDESGKFSIWRPDLNEWHTDELKSYYETIKVEPPSDSRFPRTYFTLDHEQLSSKELKPVVLEGAWVSGRILSAKTKQPLEGIQIQANSEQSILATSNAEGAFRFAMRPGQQSIRFAPRWMSLEERRQYHEDPITRSVRQIDVLDNEPADLGIVLLDIESDAAKPLTIRVVMSDGRPADDCLVFLSQYKPTAQGSARRIGQVSLVHGESIQQYVLTDSEGVAVVQPAMGWIVSETIQSIPRSQRQTSAANVLTIAYPSKSPRYFASLEIPEEIPSDGIDLGLTEGARYSGKVLLNGSPVPGVMVCLDEMRKFGSNASSLPTDLLQAETNERGEYALYVPVGNSYAIRQLLDFPKRGWATTTHHRLPVATEDPFKFTFADIELASGNRRILGKVVDGEGRPVQGVRVSCESGSKILANQSSTTTRDDGKFLFTNLPDGSLTLVARTGLNVQAKVEVLDEQTEVRILISR